MLTICTGHISQACSSAYPLKSGYLQKFRGGSQLIDAACKQYGVHVGYSSDNACCFVHVYGHRMRKLLLLLCLLLMSLPSSAVALRVQDGDLLFVTAANAGLSAAIDDATRTGDSPSYDHVALVAHDQATTVVLHADEHGSRQQTLATFMDEARERHRHVDVYALKNAVGDVIDAAIVQARRMLGRPYNDSYVLDENSYYCSDFIERAYRAHKVFALQPMRFRNPDTGIIAPYWIDFYRQRGMSVPEGQPGTNPNDMARSSALVLRGRLQ